MTKARRGSCRCVCVALDAADCAHQHTRPTCIAIGADALRVPRESVLLSRLASIVVTPTANYTDYGAAYVVCATCVREVMSLPMQIRQRELPCVPDDRRQLCASRRRVRAQCDGRITPNVTDVAGGSGCVCRADAVAD
jgi:hypothetical protein